MPVLHIRAAFNHTFLDTTVQSVLAVLTWVEFVEEDWKGVTESTALKVHSSRSCCYCCCVCVCVCVRVCVYCFIIHDARLPNTLVILLFSKRLDSCGCVCLVVVVCVCVCVCVCAHVTR